MEEKIVNPCIACNVTQCRHHCGDKHNCSLERISVSKQNSNATSKKETICSSFECRCNSCDC